MDKLETIKQINCLYIRNINEIFEDEHLSKKYLGYKNEWGQLGVFKFVMSLDTCNAKKLFTYLDNRG